MAPPRGSLPRWLYRHRLGNRGWDLVQIGLIWVVVGWSITQRDPDPQDRVPLEYLGVPVRVAIWYAAAAIAIAVALWGSTRTPGWVGDHLGFAALVMPAALRALSYWTAWAEGALGLGGAQSLWPNAVLWTTVCLLIYRLARRPEMPSRPGGGDYGRRTHHPWQDSDQ